MIDDSALEDAVPPLDLAPLFQPLSIRGMTLRNRFVMPGMQRGWCEGGRPAPQLVDYYRRRAAGGTALIITESCAIDHPTSTQAEQFGWLTDATKQSWRECVEAVRSEGGHLLVQLWHEGAIRTVGGSGPLAAHPTISPSGLIAPGTPNGRAATREEMAEIQAEFVRAALNAEEIGASGVEIHACHGYLLDQFLWSGTNRRTDGYGGDDIHDRVRFPAEIVRAVREAVSDEFVISFRFSQWKEADYGASIAPSPGELEILLATLRSAGVDLFHASTRRFWEAEWPEIDPDRGIAGWTSTFTDARVAAVGSVGLDIDVMENFSGQEATATGLPSFVEMLRRFNRGDFDLISVGRGMIGDPEWVRKVREGAIAQIRPFTRADVIRTVSR